MAAIALARRTIRLSRTSEHGDASLVTRVADGDGAALRSLWDQHASAVLGYLRTLCADAAVAEDLLQETFTAAWRGARSFRGDASVRTWLLAIARRRARDRRRAPALDVVSDSALRGVADDASSTQDAALARVELAEVVAAIRTLRAAHQEVLALAYSHELTHPEIALVLDVPLGTVKSRLHAARRALLEALHA